MPVFLSNTWFEEFEVAARSERIPIHINLTIAYEILMASGDVTRYALVISDGGIAVLTNELPDPDVTFVTSESVAAAIHQGTLSTQEAAAGGNLKVKGDVSILGDAFVALAECSDAFTSAHARTTYT